MKKTKKTKRFRKIAALVLSFSMLVSPFANVEFKDGNLALVFNKLVEAASGTIDSSKSINDVISDATLKTYILGLLSKTENNTKVSDLVSYDGEMIIPAGVTNITGLGYMRNASSIDLSKTKVTEISKDEFNSCNFESITLPTTVTKIGENAFYNCSKMITINNTNNVTYIGANAFSGCAALAEISLKSSMEFIGDGAFATCKSMKNATVPIFTNSSLVHVVPANIFNGCESLELVKFEDSSITTINNKAFSNTGALSFKFGTGAATNKLPSSVTTIGVSAFEGSQIPSIDLSATSMTEISDTAFKGADLRDGFSFPTNTTKIGYQAFQSSKVSSIVMPNSVTTLGEASFAFTSNIKTVKISTKVKEIPATCFQALGTDTVGSGGGSYIDLSSIGGVSVTFNGASSSSLLEYIGKSAFNCALIGNADFLVGLTKLHTIDENAFSYSCLNEVTIPKCVQVINDYAFYAIASLVKVSFEDGSLVKDLPNYCFGSQKAPETKKVNNINYVIVHSCINLQEIKLPDSLESIGEYCFGNCYNFDTAYGGNSKKVANVANFPNTLNTIKKYAFYTCSYHPAVDLSDASTAAKGQYKFNNIPMIFSNGLPDTVKGGMNVINIPDSVVTIEEGAFSNNLNLEELNLGAGVTEIPKKMCENCGAFASKKYTENDINSTITAKSIGKDNGKAFNETTDKDLQFEHDLALSSYNDLPLSQKISFWGLRKVTMTDNVEKIGESAFSNSYNLSEIKVGNKANGFLPDGLTEIGNSAFSKCKSLTKITIPSHLEKIGNACFSEAAINLKCTDKINGYSDYSVQVSGLEEVDFSFATSITEIGTGAFAKTFLKSIEIPASVKKIPQTMCNNCFSLEKIDVKAEDGESIGSKAFADCYNLKNATLPLSATWNMNLFSGITSNKTDTLTLTSSRESDSADVVVGEENLLSFKAFSGFGSNAHLTVSEISNGEGDKEVKLLDNNVCYDKNDFIKIVDYNASKAGEINVEGKKETGNTPVKLKITGSVDLGEKGANTNKGNLAISVSQKYDVSVVQNKIDDITLSTSNTNSLVTENNKLVQYLNLENTSATKIIATYTPHVKEFDTTETIKWNSSNPGIVNFNGSGTLGKFNASKGTNTNTLEIIPNSVGETVIYPTTPTITNQKYPIVVRVRVPATSISMTSQLNLVKGGSFTLSPKLTYDETKYGHIVDSHRDVVTFTSSNTDVATVTSDTGIIKALSEGTTNIICRSLVTGRSASCKLTVVANATSIKSLELVCPQMVYENGNRVIYLGTTRNTSANMQINYTPQAVTDVVRCYSSNPKVVEIAEGEYPNMVNGSSRILIKGLSNGTATITIQGGKISATCKVVVSTPETEIKLSKSEATINKGSSLTLKGTVLPAGAIQSLTWTSSNPSVATVSNGKVKAVSVGTTNIVARSKNGVTATCRIEVKSPAKGLKIRTSTGNTKKVYVAKGSNVSLFTYYTNDDCTDTFKFSAKKNKKGKVNANGIVIAKKKGKFTVNLTAYNNGKKSAKTSIKVYVVKKAKNAKKVKISGKKKVKVGKKINLTAKLKPASSTNTVSWSVNKYRNARINTNGVLTGIKKGTVKVTATAQNGKKKTIKIKVTK